jgi:SAM-dependent methyltransferase
MNSPYLSPYADPDVHLAVSGMIRRRSVNTRDIREVTLQDEDLSGAVDVLELGCGFGFMTMAVAPRVDQRATITGLDACPANRKPFLDTVTSAGRRGIFQEIELQRELPFDDRSFDLIIASFSLYFFPDLIPEIARVLKPAGRFLTLTHSERSFCGLLRAINFSPDNSPLLSRIACFSAENGGDKLSAHFGRVARIPYHNQLEFSHEHGDDFLSLLRFKLPLLIGGRSFEESIPLLLIQRAMAALRSKPKLVVEKSDMLFSCGAPRCQ